jgi:hypothetical protein
VRTAFRIVAGLFGALALVFSLPFAVLSFFDEEEKIHLVHNLGGLAVYGVILGVGLLALAARPEGNVATFQGLALAAVGALVGGVVAGDLVEGLWFVPAVLVLILFALYPGRGSLVRPGRAQVGLMVLVAAATVPLVAYALTQAGLQSDGSPVNPHVDLHHYSGMAAGALMLLLFAIAPALGARGWRLAAWLAGVAMAIIAVGSLAYGDRESALEATWAWLALGWAVAFVGVAELSERRDRTSVSP